jgi:hypothetical protein
MGPSGTSAVPRGAVCPRFVGAVCVSVFEEDHAVGGDDVAGAIVQQRKAGLPLDFETGGILGKCDDRQVGWRQVCGQNCYSNGFLDVMRRCDCFYGDAAIAWCQGNVFSDETPLGTVCRHALNGDLRIVPADGTGNGDGSGVQNGVVLRCADVNGQRVLLRCIRSPGDVMDLEAKSSSLRVRKLPSFGTCFFAGTQDLSSRTVFEIG